MKRVVDRLRQLGPRPLLVTRYVVHHTLSRAARRRLRSSYPRAVVSVPAGARLRVPAIDLPEADALPAPLRPAADRIRVEAEAAARHEVDLLGSGPVRLDREIDWHRDFKSGYRWPRLFYQDVQVTRLDDESDAKVPWELSRGHHLLTLARGSTLWSEERFAQELEAQLAHWLAANPVGYGINWTNPMEAAIRSVNWIWALATLEHRRRLQSELREEVTRSLQHHGRHIAANLEGSPWLRSNHYLADVLGLLVLGASLDGDPLARRWLRKARSEFERQIRAQVFPDGVAFEASLSYHALVLEMFLLARYVCRWAGVPLSSAYDERLHAMLVVVRSVRHRDGRLPQFGDSDSGRILPAGTARPATGDHLLWLGAAELGASPLLTGPPHEEVAWIFGLSEWERVSESSARAEIASGDGGRLRRGFPHGGVFVLEDEDVHAVVRCGDVGQNGNGGHAHNDVLSFELSLDGTVLVVDSGTYLYTSDVRARDAFRATAAHNTVVVGGEEINPIDRTKPFALRQVAMPHVLESGQQRLVAEHDGYRRLPSQTVHRRTFALEQSGLRIEDQLLGSGSEEAFSYVHLAPGSVAVASGPLEFDVSRGSTSATVRFIGVDAASVEEGWTSSSYGVRERAPVLRAVVRGTLPRTFVCEIHASRRGVT